LTEKADKKPMGAAERNLTRSAGLVGIFTLASRILGLVRDAVMAAIFPKAATDAFLVAFTIPNVLRRLLAEGALTVALIPIFTEYREQKGEAEARRLLANALGTASLVLVAACALCIVFAPQVVRAFAWGFGPDPDKFALATLLTRLVFPFLFFVGLTALAMGVLNTYKHFSAPALAPVVLNVVMIACALFGPALLRLAEPGLAGKKHDGGGWDPITMLAVGAVLGGLFQVVLQLPFLKQRGMLVWPRFDFRHPGVKRMATLMIPSVFGLALYQFNVIASRQFASFLPVGAVSVLYYAQRVIEFPIGIFAAAIATVAMPNMAKLATAGDLDGLKRTYQFAMRLVMFVMLPSMAGLIAISLPLTSIMFQRGAFSSSMALETALALSGFAAGLWAAGGVRQTVPVFFALQDTRTPVKVSAICFVVYLGSAVALFRPLGTLGLALAVTFSTALNFVLLAVLLRRRVGPLGYRQVLHSGAKATLAAVACGVVARAIVLLGDWDRAGGDPLNYGVLLLALVGAILVYTVICLVLRSPELGELVSAFRRRGRRRRSTSSQTPGDSER
jgi:putative peptidoglycan lipid II flippase